MKKTHQDHRTPGFPQGFSKILESWFCVIHDYTKRSGGDAIYWYNERVNVSAFASALSRNSCSVIEEFGCVKGYGPDKNIGRADISFYQHGTWYLAEAKLRWKLLSARSKAIDTKKFLDSSCVEAKRTWHGDKGTEAFGLTFVVPWIRPAEADSITDYVQGVIEQLEADSYCDFWAYCAPASLRGLQQTGENKNYFPMVIALAKRC